ncbi:MAG: ribonuclease III [Gammaproteobacteria bacterium]|nr:ribonuclease III [Gammaproteobacteria bacterium]
MSADAGALLRTLGYAFRDPALLDSALTHRSAGGVNNERLEYLGDAVLGLVIAEDLYRRYPQASEGELSRLRASLVRKQTLAELARDLQLGEYLRLGSGELKSGGYRRDSILADALEAIFGAVYLDGGFAASAGLIQTLYAERLQNLPTEPLAIKDPKTQLQEYLQSRHLHLPEYAVVSVRGDAHDQIFEVECHIVALTQTTRAQGSSRRRAEQQAAQQMLEQLGV